MNLLFVCTSHFNRSPTAEIMFKKSGKYKAKSAGLGFLCDVKIDEKLVEWADIIFVMDEEEEHQKTFLLEKFKNVPGIAKKVRVLGIPDEYIRNSPELIEKISERLRENGIDMKIKKERSSGRLH